MTLPTPPRFSRVRFRGGYAINEVDEFVTATGVELGGRLPNAALAARILEARFGTTRLRPGYDMSEVDEFLDRLHQRALQV